MSQKKRKSIIFLSDFDEYGKYLYNDLESIALCNNYITIFGVCQVTMSVKSLLLDDARRRPGGFVYYYLSFFLSIALWKILTISTMGMIRIARPKAMPYSIRSR